jgi:hypothetical protein
LIECPLIELGCSIADWQVSTQTRLSGFAPAMNGGHRVDLQLAQRVLSRNNAASSFAAGMKGHVDPYRLRLVGR